MNPKIRTIMFTSFIILFSCVFLIVPIPLLTRILSSYAVIEYNNTYQYESATSIHLEVEIGDVELVYMDMADTNVKIETYMKMSGKGLAEKTCLDYVVINGGILTESYSYFSLNKLPEFMDSESLTINITIRVVLQKNVVYNISSNVDEGNVHYQIPFGVHIQNLDANVSEGNILFDLSFCTLEGNITGVGEHTNIEIRSKDVRCIANAHWLLNNYIGELIFNISQSIKMGANITGIGGTQSCYTRTWIEYNDKTSDVGSVLTLNNWHGSFPSQCSRTGFNYGSIGIPPDGYNFTSFDYPAENNFNISVNNSGSVSQPYYWNLFSEPN